MPICLGNDNNMSDLEAEVLTGAFLSICDAKMQVSRDYSARNCLFLFYARVNSLLQVDDVVCLKGFAVKGGRDELIERRRKQG